MNPSAGASKLLSRLASLLPAGAGFKSATPLPDAPAGASPPSDGFVAVGALPPADGLFSGRLPGGETVAIVVRGGKVEGAVGSVCPHSRADLACGDIEDGGGPGGAPGCSVVCPKHRKRFDGGLRFSLETGRAWMKDGAEPAAEFNAAWTVPVYDVLEEGGALFVRRRA